MASKIDEEGPVNPRSSQNDAECDFFGKHWGNPEIESGVLQDELGVLEVGAENSKAMKCEKNPGHKNFFEVGEFSKASLLAYSTEVDDVFDYITSWIPFVVKITVKEVSRKRWKKEEIPFHATGVIDAMKSIPENQLCPCEQCKKADEGQKKHRYWSFIVYTACHVIFDDVEAASSEFECFYDSEDNKEVNTLYGIKISRTICDLYTFRTDRCQVLCITHDEELADRINALTFNSSMLNPFYQTNLGVIISHPHGMSKRISVGKIEYLYVPINDFPKDTKVTFGEGAQYRLPSSWQPDTNQPEKQNDGFKLEPGTHELSPQMKYVLPSPDETDWGIRFKFSELPWLSFPSGATFFLPNGEEFKFPPETEFSIDMISQPYVYASYNIPTCSGSSGALILMDWGEPPVEGFRHFGTASNKVENDNKSGRQLYVQ